MIVSIPTPDPAPVATPGQVRIVTVTWTREWLPGLFVRCTIPAMWKHRTNWAGHGSCRVLQ